MAFNIKYTPGVKSQVKMQTQGTYTMQKNGYIKINVITILIKLIVPKSQGGYYIKFPESNLNKYQIKMRNNSLFIFISFILIAEFIF